MSTNYYFVNKEDKIKCESKNAKLRHETELFENKLVEIGFSKYDVERLVRESIYYLECEPSHIHIGKRSSGWKPLFQVQDEYGSIAEMKAWYKMNSDEWIIENEYGLEHTWEQLEQELINWKSEKNSKSHLHFGSNYIEIDGYDFYNGDFF